MARRTETTSFFELTSRTNLPCEVKASLPLVILHKPSRWRNCRTMLARPLWAGKELQAGRSLAGWLPRRRPFGIAAHVCYARSGEGLGCGADLEPNVETKRGKGAQLLVDGRSTTPRTFDISRTSGTRK